MMQVPTQDMPPPAIPGIPATATALEAVKTVKSTPVTPPGKDTPVSPPGKGYPATSAAQPSAAQPISPKNAGGKVAGHGPPFGTSGSNGTGRPPYRGGVSPKRNLNKACRAYGSFEGGIGSTSRGFNTSTSNTCS